MAIDTRNTEDPIPHNWSRRLTDLQVLTINRYESYGWDLWFIRRPRGQDWIPVLRNLSTGETVVVDEEGELVSDHGLIVRD